LKIKLLWFGRPAASPYEGQIEGYRKKVQGRWPAADEPLRPASGGRDNDPARALRAEAALVRGRIADRWRLVVLDESGISMDSRGFAGMLADAEESGVPGVAFVIGSDIGVDADLRAAADTVLSLGPMTLPHLLARLVLWEQLFRATRILIGGGYHRERGGGCHP
jgi:23S rRNA (pseudouridine1915-N3)-methyltransferase